ncbi:MAG: iron-sulfur cluster assembly accessory protein [Candidatus Binatia bacterium]
MIEISERAAQQIHEAVRQDEREVDGLRVRVVGGGCSGLQYRIDLDSERKGDKVFEQDGARLYIDRKSYLYLNGTCVNYEDGLQNVGFQLDNPNVTKTCGCGESFVV